MRQLPFALALIAASAACASRMSRLPDDGGAHVHADSAAALASNAAASPHAMHGMGGEAQGGGALPAGAAEATARLTGSPRHGEWVMVPGGSGAPGDSVRAWLVYPERRTNAPVVVVIHEIFGLTPWIRSVADQLAADGFIAIAPDLLTGKSRPNLTNLPDSAAEAEARAVIRTLDAAVVQRHIDAVARYAMALPAAAKKYGIVGFCWGGSTSFAHAVHARSALGASVVYYGPSPRPEQLAAVQAPVLGLYGQDDQRVNATIPAADSAMRAMGKSFVQRIYTGAGHGFLRGQTERNGANMEATRQAWPETVGFFRRHLGS